MAKRPYRTANDPRYEKMYQYVARGNNTYEDAGKRYGKGIPADDVHHRLKRYAKRKNLPFPPQLGHEVVTLHHGERTIDNVRAMLHWGDSVGIPIMDYLTRDELRQAMFRLVKLNKVKQLFVFHNLELE